MPPRIQSSRRLHLNRKADARRQLKTRRRAQRRLATRPGRSVAGKAQRQLQKYRNGSKLALAITALLMMIVTSAAAERNTTSKAAGAASDPAASLDEATTGLRDLFLSAYGFLPKILLALGVIVVAAVLTRLIRRILRHYLKSWSRASAVSAMSSVLIFVFAFGVAVSVIVEDAAALAGSLGLAGLALSWALQTPIESFTGWLLNSFKGYYKIGDRIEVGEVFGDVYKIDVLTTTVWEAGGPDKSVKGAQPTGALITFPNSEVLRANIINYTKDFPYVWDEITQGITNESDVQYSIALFERVAKQVVGVAMQEAARRYSSLLESRGLDFDIATEPQVFVSNAEAWTNFTVRYLVPARERRKWSTRIVEAITAEIAKPQHIGKVAVSYPRTQVEFVESKQAGGRRRHAG